MELVERRELVQVAAALTGFSPEVEEPREL